MSFSGSVSLLKTLLEPPVVVVAVPASRTVIESVTVTGGLVLDPKELE